MSRKRKPSKAAPDRVAEWQVSPEFRAANTVAKLDKSGNVADLAVELLKRSGDARQGNLGRAEQMLLAQAHTLDALFHRLAAASMTPGRGEQGERLLRLALKAQGQCARTLEVLAGVKNPPVVYARQANVTTGPQQINNGIPAQAREAICRDTGEDGEPAQRQAGQIETGQTQLLEQQHGERLDFGATTTTGGANPPLEAVGTVNRPED
jgi:hypothetical protein